jgi:HNH endonuclease
VHKIKELEPPGRVAFLFGESMTKEEVIAAIQQCAAALGHVPTYPELEKLSGMNRWNIRKNFANYGQALEASGVERRGSGHSWQSNALFVTWAEIARSLKKIPTTFEYETMSRHDSRALMRRCGGWRHVPQRMLEYIRMEHLEGEWGDVLEVVLKSLEPPGRDTGLVNKPSSPPSNMSSRRAVMPDRPMYGTPLLSFTPSSPLSCAPINEAGVLFLFGAVARQLGFVVTRLQQEFPDGEALREVEPGFWQRLLIEFEYESRNFLLHGHRVQDCDLIVCWSHNWAECPLEVIELKSIVWT